MKCKKCNQKHSSRSLSIEANEWIESNESHPRWCSFGMRLQTVEYIHIYLSCWFACNAFAPSTLSHNSSAVYSERFFSFVWVRKCIVALQAIHQWPTRKIRTDEIHKNKSSKQTKTKEFTIIFSHSFSFICSAKNRVLCVCCVQLEH